MGECPGSPNPGHPKKYSEAFRVAFVGKSGTLYFPLEKRGFAESATLLADRPSSQRGPGSLPTSGNLWAPQTKGVTQQEGRNISIPVEPQDQLIPDPGRVPVPTLLRSRWFLAGTVLFAAFIAVGFYSQTIHDKLTLDDASAIARGIYSGEIFIGVAEFVPALGALVMIWVAFASPRWSDRLLWSTAMILTAVELSAIAGYVFTRSGLSGTMRTYPNELAVTGLVAYGSWLLIIDRGALRPWAKATLGLLCILALLYIASCPLINPYLRLVDMLGSGAFSGALFFFGIFVAERVGVSLFQRDERPTK